MTRIWTLGWVVIGIMASSLEAANVYWTNDAGGNFTNAANWNPNTVPGAADNTIFTNLTSYSVDWTSSELNSSATVSGSAVTANIGSSTYTLANDFVIGENLLGASAFNVTGGTLAVGGNQWVGYLVGGTRGDLSLAGATNTVALDFNVGFNNNTTGIVLLTSGSLLQQTGAGNSFYIGNTSLGQLTASNSTILSAGDQYVGYVGAGANGRLILVGSTNIASRRFTVGHNLNANGFALLTGGSLLQQTGSAQDFVVGWNARGMLIASNSTVSAAGNVYLAQNAGNLRGEVYLDGSTFTAAKSVNVGYGSTGVVVLTSGSLFQQTGGGEGFNVGSFDPTLGNGTLIVSNSTVSIAGYAQYGAGGNALVSLVNSTNTIGSGLYIAQGAGTTLVDVVADSLLKETGGSSYIGYSGAGELRVANSTVEGTAIRVGETASGTGIVSLASSTLLVTGGGQLRIGHNGVGHVVASNSFITVSGLEKVGFNGKSSSLTLIHSTNTFAGRLDVAEQGGASGTILLTDGSLFQQTVNQEFVVGVGGGGSGVLIASNSAVSSAGSVIVGRTGTGNGSLALAGSTWTLVRDAGIGYEGTGVVTATAGSLINQTTAGFAFNVGSFAGGVGRVTLSNSTMNVAGFTQYGAGGYGEVNLVNSTNIVAEGVYVGGGGTGVVRLAAGSFLQASGGGLQLGSAGFGEVISSNSTLSVLGDEFVGSYGGTGNGSLTLVASTNTVTGAFLVGRLTTGTVMLANGSVLNATSSSDFVIGGYGKGTLIASNSTISANGQVYFGQNGGTSRGNGTLVDSTFTAARSIHVGNDGDGVVVLSGSQLLQTNSSGLYGLNIAGSTGNSGQLIASNSIITVNGYAQYGLGSRAEVTLVNSTNTIAGALYIAQGDTGIVNVVSGSLLEENSGGHFHVGYSGYAELNVSNSTVRTTSPLRVGSFTPAATGVVRLDGGLIQALSLSVGSNSVSKGTGSVTITSGGVLEANSMRSGFNGSGTIVNRGGTYQFTSINPVIEVNTANSIVLTNGTISYRDVTAADINHAQVANITFQGNNTFKLNHASNAVGLATYKFDSVANTGNPANYQTLALTSGARWRSTTLAIGGGGALIGSGTVESTIVTNEGTISPGFSPGVIDMTGDLTLENSSLLLMELAGTGSSQYDQINVAGVLAFDGTLTVSLIDAFTPSGGDSFDILDFASSSGTFSTLNLPALGGGLNWDTSALYTLGTLSVSAIPEPSVVMLLGAGALLLWRRRGDR